MSIEIISTGQTGLRVKLTSHFFLVPRLRMRRAVLLPSLLIRFHGVDSDNCLFVVGFEFKIWVTADFGRTSTLQVQYKSTSQGLIFSIHTTKCKVQSSAFPRWCIYEHLRFLHLVFFLQHTLIGLSNGSTLFSVKHEMNQHV